MPVARCAEMPLADAYPVLTPAGRLASAPLDLPFTAGLLRRGNRVGKSSEFTYNVSQASRVQIEATRDRFIQRASAYIGKPAQCVAQQKMTPAVALLNSDFKLVRTHAGECGIAAPRLFAEAQVREKFLVVV